MFVIFALLIIGISGISGSNVFLGAAQEMSCCSLATGSCRNVCSQGIKLGEEWGNVDIMVECLTPMVVQFGAFLKATNCIIHRRELNSLLETIRGDWSGLRNEKETEILKRYAQDARYLTQLYAVSLYIFLVLYLMIPLTPMILDVIVPLNESRELQFLYQTQYYVDPEANFLWIMLHTYSMTILTITTVVATDTMFVCYVLHVCAVLSLIGYRVENLTTERTGSDADFYEMSKAEEHRCYREIAFCIDHHYRIIEAAKIIESAHSASYLIAFSIAMVLLSTSAVQILMNSNSAIEVIRLIAFNLGQFVHLLFNSWPCQRLIDESEKFRESLYASEWYSLSERNKHLLRFTLMRTLEPQKITVGKLYVMSMENFGSVIQSSVSYFTVFASVR